MRLENRFLEFEYWLSDRDSDFGWLLGNALSTTFHKMWCRDLECLPQPCVSDAWKDVWNHLRRK